MNYLPHARVPWVKEVSYFFLGQSSRSHRHNAFITQNGLCLINHNCYPFTHIIMKLHTQTSHEWRMCPIDFWVTRSRSEWLIRPNKKIPLFPVSQPTLIFTPDPSTFNGTGAKGSSDLLWSRVVRRPSVVCRPLDYLHFRLLLQNRLMDFDETWYGWSTQCPLQVLLFFGQIPPVADPGRGKNRSRGVPFFRKLLLQTGRLQQQTECIAVI